MSIFRLYINVLVLFLMGLIVPYPSMASDLKMTISGRNDARGRILPCFGTLNPNLDAFHYFHLFLDHFLIKFVYKYLNLVKPVVIDFEANIDLPELVKSF